MGVALLVLLANLDAVRFVDDAGLHCFVCSGLAILLNTCYFLFTVFSICVYCCFTKSTKSIENIALTYCFVRFPGSPGGVPGSLRVSSQKVQRRFREG